MKKGLVVTALVVLAIFVGTRSAKGKPQQTIAAKFSCSVPKDYGDFKGMSGPVFIFENQSSGTIKTLTCEADGWHPQIQITRQ
ncbi:MAG TPA: hypothetical protein VE263_06105 [Candidatus Angelobacter sp.]|nr:hypothetical protein [Candidatus Angelobacter sp.]